MAKKATVKAWGEEFEVEYDGNMWQSRATGRRFVRAQDAMRDELEQCASEGGDELDEEEIEEILGRIETPYSNTQAKETDRKTYEGLSVYDLQPQGGELWLVAGPAGYDASTIDPDDLPDGFRWVTSDEWEDIPNLKSDPFILVFRPHQTPAWAIVFQSDREFIESWKNGDFDRRCFTNSDLSEKQEIPTYENATLDVGHDLHNLTRLDSAEQVERYLFDPEMYGRHNRGSDKVAKAAIDLGWIQDGDEESDDDSDE